MARSKDFVVPKAMLRHRRIWRIHADTPNGLGHPAYCPNPEDREEVFTLAAAGVQGPIIAQVFRVSYKTFLKYFREELYEGRAVSLLEAFGKLQMAVRRGEPWAIKFKLERHGGMAETVKLEHTGAEGGPIDHVHRLHEAARVGDARHAQELYASLMARQPVTVDGEAEEVGPAALLPSSEP